MEPRVTLITLGVDNLEKSFAFYKNILGFPSKDGITGDVAFFQLKGVWLALHPKDKLAQDAKVPEGEKGFSGITLAHNVRTKKEVDLLIKKLRRKGVRITKEPQNTDWGGYDAYFQDEDGCL